MPLIKRYHLEPATLEASEADAGDVKGVSCIPDAVQRSHNAPQSGTFVSAGHGPRLCSALRLTALRLRARGKRLSPSAWR